MKLNILVCGKSGIGKTSLVNCLTGGNVVPKDAIGNGCPVTKGINIYEKDPFRFLDAEGIELNKFDENKKLINDEMLKRLTSENIDNTVHAVIYCIAGSEARLQLADLKYLKEIMHLQPTIVFTKSDITQRQQKIDLMQEAKKLELKTFWVSVESLEGTKELVEHFTDNLSELYYNAKEHIRKFKLNVNKGIEEVLAERDEEADSYIRWGAGRAFTLSLAAFIPFSNLPLLLANESWMFYKLAEIYKIPADEALLKSFIGLLGASFGGKVLASIIPGFKAIIAGSVTFGVGAAMKAFLKNQYLSKDELDKIKSKASEEAKKHDMKKWDK